MSVPKLGLIFVLFTFCTISVSSQTISPQDKEKADAYLSSKDISEAEIKAKLLEKGIDLDNLRPEQIATVEFEIQQAIKEIELERNKSVTPADTTQKDSIKKVVKKDGKDTKEKEIEDKNEKKSTNQKVNPKDYIFGHHLFFNGSIDSYDRVESNSVPGNYVLDAGDKIAINIFGTSQADLIYEIEEDGFIRPTGLYKIYLKGVTFSKAKELLRKRFAMAYRFQNDQFNVNLESARTINVNIYGDVNKPGSYSISALNNIFNAIQIAGGPSNLGSVRQIKVVSNNSERTIDFYEYISNPERSGKLSLSNGDVIFLPKVTKIVGTKGNAFRDGGWKYELKEDEHFNELLDIVGQLNGQDIIQQVQLNTREGEKQVVRDYSFKEAITSNLELIHEDIVTMNQATYRSDNFYTVKGAVRRPGMYELVEGDRISTAINKTVIEKETFSQVAYLTRTFDDGTVQLIKIDVEAILQGDSSADIQLEERDELSFFLKSAFVDEFFISIGGAVREPQKLKMSPNQDYTLFDMVFLAKGFKPTATEFGFIVSKDVTNTNKSGYKIVNLKKAFDNPESAENIKLLPGDKIVVPSTMQYSEEFEIQISGAIRGPGKFPYRDGITLQELIVMGGGLKLEAATNRVDVYRLKLDQNKPTVTLAQTVTIDSELNPLELNKTFELQPFDHIVVRSVPEFELIKYVTLKGEVRYPGVYALLHDDEKISDVIKRADGLTDEAFPQAGTVMRKTDGVVGPVVTRIDKAVRRNRRHDLVLKAGDVVTIPKTIDVISIDRIGTNTILDLEDSETSGYDSSNTKLNVQINFKPKRAKWYINKYGGGFNKDAKRSQTKVVYPNGQVKRTLNLGIVKVYPKVRRGSEIKLALKEEVKVDPIDRQERAEARRARVDRIIDAATSALTLATTAITTIILSRRL